MKQSWKVMIRFDEVKSYQSVIPCVWSQNVHCVRSLKVDETSWTVQPDTWFSPHHTSRTWWHILNGDLIRDFLRGFCEVGIKLRTSPGHLSSTFCRAGQRCCPLHDTQHLKKHHQTKSPWDQLSFHKFPHPSFTQFAKKMPWPFLKPKNSLHKKLLSCRKTRANHCVLKLSR